MKHTLYQFLALATMLLFLIGLVSLLPETLPQDPAAKPDQGLSFNDKE